MKFLSTFSPLILESSMCTSNEAIVLVKGVCMGEADYL